jgi:hypothetical protein
VIRELHLDSSCAVFYDTLRWFTNDKETARASFGILMVPKRKVAGWHGRDAS